MFQMYIRTGLRVLFRNKTYSLISVIGLAVALTATLLVFLFARHELSYDSQWPEAVRIHRLEVTYHNPGGDIQSVSSAPGPLVPFLQNHFSSQLVASRAKSIRRNSIIVGDEVFEARVTYVDDTFFEIFPLEMLEGQREALSADNSSVMLSEKMALKLFGRTEVIGETFLVNQNALKVVAVMRDLPRNSHLQSLDIVTRLDPSRFREGLLEQWANPQAYSYVKFNDPATAPGFLKQLNAALDQNVSFENTPIAPKTASEFMELTLLNVSDIHLYSVSGGGDPVIVYSSVAIAVLILAIACINFLNLTTARSLYRAREVSIRKVIGASTRQVFWQFWVEALMITVFAMWIGLVMTEIAVPSFSQFLDRDFAFDLTTDYWLLGLSFLLVMLLSFAGGGYPAYKIATIKPALALSAGKSNTTKMSPIRNLLVLVQFSVSIGLITATLIILDQTRFVRSADIGYDIDARVAFEGVKDSEVSVFRSELARIDGVQSVTFASDTMPRQYISTTSYIPYENTSGEAVILSYLGVDTNFFDFFGIAATAGRTFSADYTGDVWAVREGTNPTFSMVINETAVPVLGFSSAEAALNKVIRLPADGNGISPIGTVVGVIPDIMTRSAKQGKSPEVFIVFSSELDTMSLKLSGINQAATLEQVKQVWRQVTGNRPATFSFLEDKRRAMYHAEMQQSKVFLVFAFIAIVVSVIGLYGLSHYSAVRRTKEVGIRKVLGAKTRDILLLLAMQFSKPVLFANVIAWPITAYFMQQWLMSFATRIDLSVLYFLIAGTTALVVAMVTVAGQVYRVAQTRPMVALRFE